MDFALKSPETNPFLTTFTSVSDIEKDNIGEEVQRLSVLRDLPALIQFDERGCLQRVVQKIQQALNNATTEFHIEAARAFSVVLEKKSVSHITYSQAFLPSVILHVDNRDQVVSNAWLETLLNATELLPSDIVKKDILVVAINKGQISQNVWHRVAACKLLGKLCSRFDSQIVKKDILPVVLSLCQDINESVRACICSQLHLVAKGLPADMIRPALIPILVELGRDETIQVRVEATETIVKIIPFVSHDVLKVTIIPLIRKICEQALVTVDETLVIIAKQFGSLCVGLDRALTSNDKLWLINYFSNLSHMGLPSRGAKKDVFLTSQLMDRVNARYIECRQFCAYNFPAIAKFCSSSPELLEKVYPSFCDFATDPYYMVRKTIGAGLHEVARIWSSNNRVVKNQVMTLLWDNMEEVLMGVVPHLGRTLDFLILSGVLGHDQDGVVFDLGRGLLQCDKTIRSKTHNWRLQTDFITQLESIVKCLPSDYIFTHFVSLMFDKMHQVRPLPCRLAAARTLLVFLRYNVKSNQRQEIRSRLQSEFCFSSSCYKRMLYLRMCSMAREVFSRAYFKEHFFFPLLSRSEDKVANNRLILIRQFPYLKAMIVMPSEKKYLNTLESCCRSMAISEKDRDVAFEFRAVVHRMDRTETLYDNPTTQTPEDTEDRRKYDEEMKVLNAMVRPGQVLQLPSIENRRVPRETKSNISGPNETKPNYQPPSASPSPSPSPSATLRPERIGTHVSSTQSITSSHSHGSTGHTPSQTSNVSGTYQGFTNTTNNLYSIRTSLIPHKATISENCTCFSIGNFRSENLRNLNLLALIDTSLVHTKQKLSETLKQKLSEDPRFKMSQSSKHNIEISWLNLETDLKKELFALVKNRQIHGDRNFKEKSKFLTDFRNYNESSLSKFISEDRDFKETIYSVTGLGMSSCYERNTSNFFEERLNFFERKIKLEDAKTNNTNPGDCSCFELTTNRAKSFESEEAKKFSYFSKNFEEDFYRDAGVKANEIIGRKFSGIPVYDKPTIQVVSTPKVSTSVTNKRRTWFGNENLNPGTVKLETITGFKEKSCERKKSETLPARESVSLKKLGIGTRSKSFILPSTRIYSDKQVSDIQSTKLVFNKEKEMGAKTLESEGGGTQNNRNDAEANKFGFRSKTVEPSPRIEQKVEKALTKTKIPIGRVSNGSSPGGSRSTSPNIQGREKDKGTTPQTNGTKKIPVVVSRKSMLIQSNSVKSEVRNNRRSLDSTKISLANMDKGQAFKKRSEKVVEKVKNGECGGTGGNGGKGEGEGASVGNSSKLPIRRPRPNK